MSDMSYDSSDVEIIRSNRKTVSLEIRSDGHLRVRAPLHMSETALLNILKSRAQWIEEHRKKLLARKASLPKDPPLSMEELRHLADEAVRYIPRRVAFYAPLVGVSYGRITIRNQKSKWGSCSAKGNLNFNCLLMLTPPEVIDSVVVHELCHRKEMNHSARLYAEVLRVFPDYRRWEKWLKEHGPGILIRMTGTG